MTRDNSKAKTTPPRKNVDGHYQYNALEECLLNDFQKGFPLTLNPYETIAKKLDVDTATVISTLKKLHLAGAISRIGPVVKPNSVNSSILAALAVPDEQLGEIADLINGYAEVNHNYERDHEYNLWFVLHGPNENHIHLVLDEIENDTGLPLLRLPILDDYHIDLGFGLQWNH